MDGQRPLKEGEAENLSKQIELDAYHSLSFLGQFPPYLLKQERERDRQCHICQCLPKISTSRRSSVVTISAHRRKTGEQFAVSVYSLALGLLEVGVQRGDVIAIAAFNSDWYLAWLLAIAHVGGIAAPLNYRWSFEEARCAMEEVGPLILVVDGSCKKWLSSLQLKPVPTLKIIIFLGDPSSCPLTQLRVISQDAMRKPLVGGPPSFDYQTAPEGIVLICFTSGTTGRPKGVAISHTALIVQSLAKIAIVGYDLSPHGSLVPHWRNIFGCGHVNGGRLPCLYTKV